MIRNFFSPIRHNQNVFYINYSFIKTVQSNEEQNLLFEVFNPVMHIDISFTASNLEEQGLIFHKKLKRIQINSIMRQILQLRVNEITFLSNHLISLFYLFRDCLETEKKENKIIEIILLTAYINGKNYYEKNINL